MSPVRESTPPSNLDDLRAENARLSALLAGVEDQLQATRQVIEALEAVIERDRTPPPRRRLEASTAPPSNAA